MVSVLLRGNVRTCTRMETCVYQACELLQAERDRVERLAQIVCEQRSQLDSCPEATKEPLQEQLARVSTHTHAHPHTPAHTATALYSAMQKYSCSLNIPIFCNIATMNFNCEVEGKWEMIHKFFII